jgi:hypothetical protein
MIFRLFFLHREFLFFKQIQKNNSFVSVNMHICPTFGHSVKQKKIQPTFYASNASITQFYFISSFKYFSSQRQK